MEPLPWLQVPALTARVARASFPKGNLAMRIRDVLGEVYSDTRFASAFAVAGRSAVSPAQLMMVTVLQFTENLTDRQAADAARDRMSWKYALGVAVWVQQYYRISSAGGEVVARREADVHGLPPGRFLLISPYDLDARYSIKREHGWAGYKVHFTEGCDGGQDRDGRDLPNLITNVATTRATVPDAAMTESVHRQLAGKGLLPARHLLDSGYPSADLLVSSPRDFGVHLVTPMLQDRSVQAKAAAGYDRTAFAIDWDNQRATCPQGKSSTSWNPCSQRGTDTIVVSFAVSDCRPCPARGQCTQSAKGRRQVSLRPREIHEAQIAARTAQTSEQWKTEYATRAGVEGTMYQATTTTGVRHARYLGIDKTRLEHNIAAAAINLIRLDAYLTGKPLDRGHTSHLARLDFTLAA